MSLEPEERLELEEFVPYRLSILADTVSRALASQYAKEFDLTISQWRIMAVLGRNRDLSASEVAERTAMDKVTVSRAIAGLVRDARVAQQPDPTDGRRRRLRLTARGRSVYRRIVPRALAVEAKLIQALDRSDRKALVELLPASEKAALQVASDLGVTDL